MEMAKDTGPSKWRPLARHKHATNVEREWGVAKERGKAATGKEKERKTKWDKRFIIVSETTPAGVYWYKNESVRKAARCLR